MARLSAGGGGGGGGDWGVCAAEAMRLRGGELGVCRAYLYGGTGSPGVMVIVCGGGARLENFMLLNRGSPSCP